MERGFTYYLIWTIVWGYVITFLVLFPLSWIFVILKSVFKTLLFGEDKIDEDDDWEINLPDDPPKLPPAKKNKTGPKKPPDDADNK